MNVDHRSGTTIGPYELHEVIGRGGMGIVYRAVHHETDATVALKLLLPELAGNDDFRARFVYEAEVSPRLDHPNIIPVYETGEADGELFIAMKLVEGRDLKEVVKAEAPLDPRRVASIFAQVADALDAAHECGMVHRDVKPQNILVADRSADDECELVFVTDFGLVKPTGVESTVSRSHQILGSVQYISPEQVEGIPADGRADVYSLGCVLYECLTGKIPFDRPNEVAVLWAHVNEDPPRVTDERPELPGGLDETIARALAKHPDDRFLTCGELVAGLEAGIDKTRRPYLLPVVRPLVERPRRAKTERDVWAPNYFPELARVRHSADRPRRLRTAAVAVALSIGAILAVQAGHPRGLAGAAADVVHAAQGVTRAGDALDDSVTKPAAMGHDRRDARDRARSAVKRRSSSSSSSSSSDHGAAPRDRKPAGSSGPSTEPPPAPAAGLVGDGPERTAPRRIQQDYTAASLPADGGFSGCDGSAYFADGAGCATFAAMAHEHYLEISIDDVNSANVSAAVQIDQDADGDVDGRWTFICNDTTRAIRIQPHARVTVELEKGECDDGRSSNPTRGTIEAIFSRDLSSDGRPA